MAGLGGQRARQVIRFIAGTIIERDLLTQRTAQRFAIAAAARVIDQLAARFDVAVERSRKGLVVIVVGTASVGGRLGLIVERRRQPRRFLAGLCVFAAAPRDARKRLRRLLRLVVSGRASRGDRVWPYVSSSVVAG